jgi:hypothetical protein
MTLDSAGLKLNAGGYAGTSTGATNATVTLNSAGLAISVAAPGGGAGATGSFFRPYDEALRVAGQVGNASLMMFPVWPGNVSFNRVIMPVQYSNATNSSGSFTVSLWVGFYTSNASTLSLYASQSTSYATSNSGTVGNASLWVGVKNLTMGWSTSLPESAYWLGVLTRTTTGGAAGMTMSQFQASQIASSYGGVLGVGAASNQAVFPGLGHYSATTNALPAAISFTQIQGTTSAQIRPPIIAFVNGSA